MLKDQTAIRAQTEPIEVVHAGLEPCAPGHAFGPAVRDYFLFHYILSGCGIFQAAGQTVRLGAGQGFMIFPDQVTYYEASQTDPWHYTWLAFRGSQAAGLVARTGLTVRCPVLDADRAEDSGLTSQDCFRQVMAALRLSRGREQRLTGLVYLFLSHLIAVNPEPPEDAGQTPRQSWYVRQARDYMEMNYARKISISSLAGRIGLDRSYFGQLFHATTGLAPQQYLLQLRMAKACQLMSRSFLPIGTIAHSVGYHDPLLFSRMFRRVVGQSPTAYRRSQKQAAAQPPERGPADPETAGRPQHVKGGI